MMRVGLFIVWLLHFLPLPLLAGVGQGQGMLLYWIGRERRRVARINLRLCFPQMTDKERRYPLFVSRLGLEVDRL